MGLFGNMMNNYFYGKAGKGDYSVQDMPQNRRQLFSAVLKVRWGSMVGVNLLYVICWLPTLFWTMLNVITLMSQETLGGPQTSGIVVLYLIVLIPCLLITGPFSAGIAFVMRNWARDEHSFVMSDFWDALKANWKQSLGVSLIGSLCPLVLYFAWQFYGNLANSNIFFMIPMSFVFLFVSVWKLSEMVIYTMMVTYKLSLRNLIRNSVLISMAKLPLAILIKMITLVVPICAIGLILASPSAEMYVWLVLLFLYTLFVPAFNRLVLASYANAMCEKYLNSKIEGAETNIGLRPEDWDDTQYIPEDDED
ncbi:MAG: YesL family protein [Christensenellales bacterium]|nr:YesL family protein [Christensenellales bacterium]